MNSGLLSYSPRIDGLRFIAIAMVLLHHLGGYIALPLEAGYYGVDLFFVISGYLITGILLRDKGHTPGQSYKAFIGRRALRIFPAYYLTIAILYLLNMGPTREFFPWLATYTFNYPAAHIAAAHRENAIYYLWSLSVEEQFYLFWPPLVLLLRDKKGSLFAATCAIVLFGYAQISHDVIPSISIYNHSGTLNRMGSLGLGALGAIWVSSRPLSSRVFNSLAVELMVLALLAAAIAVDFKYRYVLMGPCSLYLVLKAGNFNFRLKPLEWLLTNKKVVYAGMISYGIYLYHVPVTVLLNDHAFDLFWNRIPFDQFGPLERMRWHPWIVKFPLYSLASIGLATISFRGFEAPLLRLKNHWFPYRAEPVASRSARRAAG